MSNPTVAAVMLVNGREAMVRKAAECIQLQTARGLSIVILDSGEQPVEGISDYCGAYCWFPGMLHCPIGELRNFANGMTDADIIAHCDSDDWSHPRRIEEQVALLQSTGADVVGYDRMLFWRSGFDESWLYTGEILGTSLCYWRKTWERTPFRAKGWHNEDYGFVTDVKGRGGNVVAISSVDLEPRMIARIHDGNASNASYQTLETHPHHWQRVPEWDEFCRERMAL